MQFSTIREKLAKGGNKVEKKRLVLCRWFWLELAAILNEMHLPEEKTVLHREDTCDTRMRPLTCDG